MMSHAASLQSHCRCFEKQNVCANCKQCVHGIPDQRRHRYRHKGMHHCVRSYLAGEGVCHVTAVTICNILIMENEKIKKLNIIK